MVRPRHGIPELARSERLVRLRLLVATEGAVRYGGRGLSASASSTATAASTAASSAAVVRGDTGAASAASAREIYAATMIDNVCITSDDEAAFIKAVQTFVARCDRYGATLNDRANIPAEPAAIATLGRKNVAQNFTFLGEVYSGKYVRNTDTNVNKIRRTFERLQHSLADSTITVTRRNVAAAIGLAIWMAHTLQIPLCEHFELMRYFAAAEQRAGSWDDPMPISVAFVNHLGALVGPLLANTPVQPQQPAVPSVQNSAYDVTIIVDASGTGYGAYVAMNDRIYKVRGGWNKFVEHSAHAEPKAAKTVLQWARAHGGTGRTAIVVDHIAMATGQRRPGTGNGGFSKAFFLNEFFRELYSDGKGADVFYCKGEDMPADDASRNNTLGEQQRTSEVTGMTFPTLAEFRHPYLQPLQRPRWNV